MIAAASLHLERWRFTYGRKLTPLRIADFVLPLDAELEAWVARKLADVRAVIGASLKPYKNELKAAVRRTARIASSGNRGQKQEGSPEDALPLFTSSAEEALHILRTGDPENVEESERRVRRP